jgi:oligosaccharide repeat unit polymerase
LASIGAEGVASYGILGRFYPLVFALFLFEHVYENKENKHLRILLWVWMLLYAFATMGKFSLLTPFVAWGIIRGIKGQLQFSKIFLLGPALLLLMIIINISRASASSIFSFADMWSTYVYSPLVALGYMDINPANQYVLRFFYAVGYRLGIAPKPVNVISPYVYVPEATNVFTVMQPFYHDWGLLGVFWGALVYALFFSLLYFYSKKEKGFALILFSGYSIALIGQFIVDLLIMHFSGNLQLFIWATLIYVFSRKADVSC